MIYLRSDKEIAEIEKACKIVAEIQEELKKIIKPGITTNYLNESAEREAVKKKVKLALKGYRGFPEGICTSVNDEVVHGIPSSRILKAGDIISIDIGILNNGYYGDGAFTVGVDGISSVADLLMRVTEKALYCGIDEARVGNRLSNISHAIQKHVESDGFSVVRDLVGHGIGRNLHEEPQIPNFGPPNRGPRLREGMVMAIEPMVASGDWKVKILNNGWTVATEDHSLSAHFEHTLVITTRGPQILTKLNTRRKNA